MNKAKAEVDGDPLQNLLLAAMPPAELAKIRPILELVNLKHDDVLWEADEKRKYVYFPTTAIICLLYESDEGDSIEVGMTGRKGMVGVVTFMGDSRMAKRAIVHHAGKAYRMRAKDVEDQFDLCSYFHDICLCYTQTLLAQLSQNAICNRLHSVEQQVCRYLLNNHDDLQTDTFLMTHEQISNVLGVRRESVSVATASLRDGGWIKAQRGKITLLDRKRLEARACECFGVVQEQYDRILGDYAAKNRAVPAKKTDRSQKPASGSPA